MKKRPVVISIIAILMLLNGVLTLINGYRFQVHPLVMVLGVIALVLSVGLWMLWPWAWVGTLLLQIAAIGYALYDWFTGGPIDFLAMIIGVIVIIYLLREETRSVFFNRQGTPADNVP
jgi:hypothetical protein